MGNDCKKANENMYFQSRKRAATYNDKLRSREGAAELLGLSVSSLADYELGNTKVVPVDKVVLMSDLYGDPELSSCYCKHECPIGMDYPIAMKMSQIERTTVRLVHDLDAGKVDEVKRTVLEIASDGIIDSNEIAELDDLMSYLDSLTEDIWNLRMICKRAKFELEHINEN